MIIKTTIRFAMCIYPHSKLLRLSEIHRDCLLCRINIQECDTCVRQFLLFLIGARNEGWEGNDGLLIAVSGLSFCHTADTMSLSKEIYPESLPFKKADLFPGVQSGSQERSAGPGRERNRFPIQGLLFILFSG